MCEGKKKRKSEKERKRESALLDLLLTINKDFKRKIIIGEKYEKQ